MIHVAAIAYECGQGFLSSKVIESPMLGSSQRFDTIPECSPVSKSASIESTESLQPHIEETTTDNMQKPLPLKEEPATKSTHRRVIFPSLYPSSASNWGMQKGKTNCHNLLSPLRKSPSFDSVTKLDTGHCVPSSKEKYSPTSVAVVLNDCIPIMPSLGLAPLEEVRPHKLRPRTSSVDPLPLIIPPFNRTLTPPDLMKNSITKVELDTPSYKKRTRSPYKNYNLISEHIMQGLVKRNDSRTPVVLTLISILRKKDDLELPPDDSPLKRVVFDPRVWVFEFERNQNERETTWYSASDMERFKRNAIERVCQLTELVPTGTGRLVRKATSKRAMFSNPALLGDEDEDELAIQRLARLELHNILVVDPHDLCCKLFVKAFKHMLPHASVSTAKSSDDALKRMERCKKPFDLIIVEERLRLFSHAEDYQVSGSAFIGLLAEEAAKTVPKNRQPLLVGVSAHFEKDQAKLEESGAAFTWPKPPPSLDRKMRDRLLKHILLARGNDQAALKYFH